MKSFTQILIMSGLGILILTAWTASKQGWGLPTVKDPQVLQDKHTQACPEHLRDAYGHCPPRSHRRSLGARSYVSSGGK